MRQPSSLGAPRDTLRPAPPTPLINFDNPALQHCTIRCDLLPSDLESELIKTAEDVQIGRVEGSVEHVEVFPLGGVGTSIL